MRLGACMSHHGPQVASDLRKIIKNMRGVEGMLRVRCSTGVRSTVTLAIFTAPGLRAVDYYGSMLVNNTSDVELAGRSACARMHR